MYKVGVTGGIGSGKSTACRIFAELGVAVYDSDAEAKRLMCESGPLREAVRREFGDESYVDGRPDRAYLASRIFADDDARRRLNSLVHPAVMSDFAAWAERQSGDYVVLESAILFEAGLESHVDRTIAVMAPERLRLQRAMMRDGATEESVRRRMACQLSDDAMRARADWAMVNVDLDELRREVEQCDGRLRYEALRYGGRS